VRTHHTDDGLRGEFAKLEAERKEASARAD
jgi:hypothetical protein